MATDLGRAKPTAANKYDAIVMAQLAKAERRIRLLDFTAGFLGFLVLILAYVVGMVLCDSKWLLAQETRQMALCLFSIVGIVFLLQFVLRPIWLRVNPYYAARQVERQLPHSKNSIVNWVDLHGQQLPPAILGALGQRAAKDFSRVDVESAITGRRTAWMAGMAGILGIAFIALFFLLGPAPFLSLLKRTFNPFGGGGVSTRTQLTLHKPEGGNVTLTVGRGINFLVVVNGKVPDPRAADAVKLRYRYEEGDSWLERPLIQEPSREWSTSLSAIEVRNGFSYQITGGDAATDEYQVVVRAAPTITDFLATYHFRPYTARAEEVHRERELKALRGTEVLLRVRTNRTLREGRLEFESKDGSTTVRGEVDANAPNTLLVRYILEKDGKYRLNFISTDSEMYSDSVAYPVTALVDQPPVVELTKPGQDIRLPADAVLYLEGKASDDVGVQGLTLRMRVVGGANLNGQAYRGQDGLRLADGGYPTEVGYEDFVELSRVQDEKNQPVALRAGMELEYWLEARDACDYPQANVGESKHYRVQLVESEKNEPKARQEQQQAEKKRKQHEQKQQQKLDQQNKDRQQQRQEQEARNQEEENKSKEGNKGSAAGSSQPKDGEQSNNSESKEKRGQGGESKDASGERNKEEKKSDSANGEWNKEEQKSESAKDEQKIEEQVKKALERKEAREDAKGESKPNKSESKETQGGKSEGSDGNGGKPQAEKKDTSEREAKEAGESKGQGDSQSDAKSSPSEGKSEHSSSPKDGDPMNKEKAEKAGEGKGKSDATRRSDPDKQKTGTTSAVSEAKPSKDKDARRNKEAGQDKQQARGKDQDADSGESKPADNKEQNQTKESADESKDQAGTKGDKSKQQDKPDANSAARKATEKEIEDLARSLADKNAHKREEAKRKLEQILKEADSLKARAKAKETLEKAGEPDMSKGNKESTNGKNSVQDPKKKRDEENRSQQSDPTSTGREEKSKSGSTDEQSNTKKNEQDSQPVESSGAEKNGENPGKGEKAGQAGDKGNGASPRGESPGDEASSGGNQAGGANGRRGQTDAANKTEEMTSEKEPNQPRAHRAAQMQLEDFAKKVNKDILKDAGVSEEAWKKYLESKRKQLGARENQQRPDTVTAPQQANRLPSMGGRTIQPTISEQDKTSGPERGQPPPGYRDPFREFTRKMSSEKK